ncbi:unnamed protein product [Amoebophrya sp. A25]|nr:unnamed protein product [Amoebophrya sp. A25]|eukprot:GSA25T00013796001.1
MPSGATAAQSSAMGGAAGGAAVIEMVDYAKSLDIDPLREPFMLWVAEAAYSAELPPDWGEYMDPQGRVYFYCSTTGESSWTHPMDPVFREIAQAYRTAFYRGGFWDFEERLEREEADIEAELENWKESKDSKGEAFFHNSKSKESTFADPKSMMYHKLYTKLKMLKMMKERNPVMAIAPRPVTAVAAVVEETEEEKEARLQREKDAEQLTRVTIRLQAFLRTTIQKKRFKEIKQRKAAQTKGVAASLRGMVRLKISRNPDGTEQIELSQTTGARREKAAVKMQALARMFLVKKRTKPMLEHRRHLGKMLVPIQTRMRICLAKKRVAMIRSEKFVKSATDIQKVQRGIMGRERVKRLQTAQLEQRKKEMQIVLIQCCVRMMLAIHRRRRLKAERRGNAQKSLASQMKCFLAAKKIHMLSIVEHPTLVSFQLQPDSLLPWRFRLQMAPTHNGKFLRAPHGPCELFHDEAAQQAYVLKAILDIQRLFRGSLVRIAKMRRMVIGRAPVLEAVKAAMIQIDARQEAGIKMQTRARGFLVRKRDIEREQLFLRFSREGSKAQRLLILAQQVCKTFWAQQYVQFEAATRFRNTNAATIQRHWRGFLSRKLVEDMVEESCWPLKGFFEYQQTGPDSVLVQVNFHSSRHFDEYRYFERYGDVEDLSMVLEEMEMEVALCVDQYLQDRSLLQPSRTPIKRPQLRAPISESPRPPVSPKGRFLHYTEKRKPLPPALRKDFQQADADVTTEADVAAAAPAGEQAASDAACAAAASPPRPTLDDAAPVSPTADSSPGSSPSGSPKKKKDEKQLTARLSEDELQTLAVHDEQQRTRDWDEARSTAGPLPIVAKKSAAAAASSPIGLKAPPGAPPAKPSLDKAPPRKKMLTNPEFIFKEPESQMVHTLFKSSSLQEYAPDTSDLDAKMPPRKVTPARIPTASSDANFDPRRPGTGSTGAADPIAAPGNAADADVDAADAGGAQLLEVGGSSSSSPNKKYKKGKFPEPLPRNPFRPEITIEQSIAGQVPDRKSYAGEFRSGRWYKNPKKLSELGERERVAILYDMKEERKRKVVFLARKRQAWEERQAVRQAEERDKWHRQMEDVNRQRDDRESRKVETLTKWLMAKEAEAKRQRQQEQETIEVVKQKQAAAQAKLDRLDMQRAQEREARLRRAEGHRAQLMEQIENARSKENSELFAQQQPQEVHRHVHHHIHYHHVNEDGEEELSHAARVHIEHESESSVLQHPSQSRVLNDGSVSQALPPGASSSSDTEAVLSTRGDGQGDALGKTLQGAPLPSNSEVPPGGAGASQELHQSSIQTGASSRQALMFYSEEPDSGRRREPGDFEAAGAGGGAPRGGVQLGGEPGAADALLSSGKKGLAASSSMLPGIMPQSATGSGSNANMLGRPGMPMQGTPGGPRVTQQHVHYHLPQGSGPANHTVVRHLQGAPVELVIPPVDTDSTIRNPPNSLSPKGLQKLGKQTGLSNFCRNISTAIDAYSDTRRPRYLRDKHFAPLPLPHERGGAAALMHAHTSHVMHHHNFRFEEDENSHDTGAGGGGGRF